MNIITLDFDFELVYHNNLGQRKWDIQNSIINQTGFPLDTVLFPPFFFLFIGGGILVWHHYKLIIQMSEHKIVVVYCFTLLMEAIHCNVLVNFHFSWQKHVSRVESWTAMGWEFWAAILCPCISRTPRVSLADCVTPNVSHDTCIPLLQQQSWGYNYPQQINKHILPALEIWIPFSLQQTSTKL